MSKLSRTLINPKMVTNQLDLLTIEEFKLKYPEFAERLRWQVFAKGYECPTCGVVGTHVVVWIDHGTTDVHDGIHTDMVAYNAFGQMILMTMDHVIPRSKGGPKHIDNLRTQCSPCNWLKGASQDARLDKKYEVMKLIGRTLSLFTYGCERKDNVQSGQPS